MRKAAVVALGTQLPVLTQHVPAVLGMLDDPDEDVRAEAFEALGNLPTEMLALHVAAFVAKLEDPCARVRDLALAMLGRLGGGGLAQHEYAQPQSNRG